MTSPIGRSDSPFARGQAASDIQHDLEFEARLDAAGNLLAKAAARLANNEHDKAQAFASRACRLPYDTYEDIHPATYWLEAELLRQLSVQIEYALDGDTRWIDRSEKLLSEVTGHAAGVLRTVLNSLLVDYAFPQPVVRRLHQLIGDGPRPFADDGTTVSVEERTQLCLDVLLVINRQLELYRIDTEADLASNQAQIDVIQARLQELEARAAAGHDT
ncbi:hypothetical protein [Kineosporia babensis]|uniref:Uncharacterized protein n=1 Tax=Kineosporia babensis TaxID=499548 RepID=A0A9X1SU05_9ACTN|nr:hypothetical protein [Kineosporia babensis]MCD5311155.1 hypothetical protein [Kineosporia babensis]